ncbi:MAG: hypothetical protein D6808_03925 [Candidatus Dadabacteria bacterium]|nr:MAG: hypothetical protein D6808_03925 [Candidatus Dadabacteria bacterium]
MIKYTVKPTITIKDFYHVFNSFFEGEGDLGADVLSKYFPGSTFMYLNYARSAMIHVIKSIGLEGKEILVPAFICKELADVFIETQTKPVFVDADLETFNMDLGLIPELITKDTAAIIAAHTFGNPVDIKELLKIKDEYGLAVIEDCAHALGGKYGDRYLGSFGDVSVFSVYKFFPTVKGGFLVINNPEIDIDPVQRGEKLTPSDVARFIYSFDLIHKLLPGIKEKGHELLYTEIPVARPNKFIKMLISCHLKDIDSEREKRHSLSLLYEAHLKDSNIRFQKLAGNSRVSRLNFPVLLPPELRDHVFNGMIGKGVLCDRLWHDAIVFSEKIKRAYRLDINKYPNAVFLSKSMLNLPLQPNYTEGDIEYVASNLKDLCTPDSS